MVYYAHGCKALTGHSRHSIELAAEQFRSEVTAVISAPPDQAFPAGELFERLDDVRVRGFGRGYKLDPAVADLGTGIEAATRVDGDRVVLTLSDETYRGLRRGDGRARFTFCHELGHAVLHVGLLRGMEVLPHLKGSLARGEYPIYYDTEWQANAFAGSILVPAATLHRMKSSGETISAAMIASTFQVSGSAAQTSLATLPKRLPVISGGLF